MTNPTAKHSVQLATSEIRLLLQSLDHCLATCANKAADKDSPCEDCDRAQALRQRLATLVAE
jgi:hypothetical protein